MHSTVVHSVDVVGGVHNVKMHGVGMHYVGMDGVGMHCMSGHGHAQRGRAWHRHAQRGQVHFGHAWVWACTASDSNGVRLHSVKTRTVNLPST
jgi:PAB1-binding protein PBP1